MHDLPRQALSVRQPWAWAIIFGGKNIENRTAFAISKGEMRPGRRIAIHAGKGMTQDEYAEGRDFMRALGVICPPPHELVRGAIIGSVFVVDIVKAHASQWFRGPRGLVLRDPHRCEPIPAIGALGYFDWKRADAPIEPPVRWMLPRETREPLPSERAQERAAAEPDLFG